MSKDKRAARKADNKLRRVISKFKQRIIAERGHECEIPGCDWSHTVELHHIDGDKYNTIRENVVLLCPNHHSLTPQANRKLKDIDAMLLEAAYFKGLLSVKYGFKYY